MRNFAKELQENGFYYLTEKMSFFQPLKNEGKITKNDAFILLKTIFTNIGMENQFND